MLIIWMAGGVQGPRTFDGTVRKIPSRPAGPDGYVPDPEVLTVVVWNLSWAYGWMSDGRGGAKPLAHFERNLDTMGRVLAAAKPDLVLLQEADFASTRSHNMDQAERLARQCGLSYIAPAETWSANYIPFPYWPPANQFGRMSSGGAVLSRYPLHHPVVELLPKPTDNPWWYNLFYLFRYLQRVEVEHPAGVIQVVNAHLEAWDEANRLNQAYRARALLDDFSSTRVIFGGDMNAVPPESPQRHGYADQPQTDNRHDETIKVLRSANNVTDTVAPNTLTSTPSAWFTFPSHAPNRKLDYIFTGDSFTVESIRVMTEAGDVSDHLPLIAKLRIKP